MKTCSPPPNPTDAYTPVLVAERGGTYGTSSLKQSSEESIAILRKQKNDNNGVAKIYTEEYLHRRNEHLLSIESN